MRGTSKKRPLGREYVLGGGINLSAPKHQIFDVDQSPVSAFGISGTDVRFLICKRTLGMAPVNDRFWPIPAGALKPSRMSELGQVETFAGGATHVRSWG